MKLMAIDPGTTHSGWVDYDTADDCIMFHGIDENEAVATACRRGSFDVLAIEDVECYGMKVGRDVFTTLKWIGRFWEAGEYFREKVEFVTRRAVKLNLCGTMRAKDSNVRQAILDRFGGKEAAIGKKASPGPLYGLRSHEWQALAVALTYLDDLADGIRGTDG